MKNKKTAYFMVPVVLVIWGVIGWKVYAAVKGNDKEIISSSHAEVKSKATEISDTVSLIANYRDPFLDKEVVIKYNSKFNNHNSKSPAVKAPDPPKAVSVWPKVSYHGLVKRSGSEKTLGFLSVNDKSYFVQGGEEVIEIKVGKLWKDSVEIVFNKEKKVFRK